MLGICVKFLGKPLHATKGCNLEIVVSTGELAQGRNAAGPQRPGSICGNAAKVRSCAIVKEGTN